MVGQSTLATTRADGRQGYGLETTVGREGPEEEERAGRRSKQDNDQRHPACLLRSLARSPDSTLSHSTDQKRHRNASYRTTASQVGTCRQGPKNPQCPSTIDDSQADSNSALLSLPLFLVPYTTATRLVLGFLLASSTSRHRRYNSTCLVWGRRSRRGGLLLAQSVRRETSPHIPHRSYPPMSIYYVSYGKQYSPPTRRRAHLACGELRC